MRVIAIIGLALLASIAVGAGNKRATLNIKPGLWEITKMETASDQMPIPAALLAKLSPAQRARLEERMKAPSSATAIKTTRYCLTTRRLNSGIPFDLEPTSCRRTIESSSTSKLEVRMRCSDNNSQSHRILRIEALSAESVRGTLQAVASHGNHNASSSFMARWVSPNCGTVK